MNYTNIEINLEEAEILSSASKEMQAVAATVLNNDTLIVNATSAHLINELVIGLDCELLHVYERAALRAAGVVQYYDTAYKKTWLLADQD